MKKNRINKKSLASMFLVLPFILLCLLLIIIPTILIFIQPFIAVSGGTVNDNWEVIDGYIWTVIFNSILNALIATIFCLLIAYPFAYFLSFNTNKIFKIAVITIVTSPIWLSFLVKLIGLKTFFDLMAGMENSTYGSIWTILGLTYLYVPFMIIPLYSVLDEMPKNLIFASRDLGYGPFKTFWKVVVPYSKTALITGVTLVFLPSITTVAVGQFLNNDSNNASIGNIISHEGENAASNPVAMSRAATLSLVTILIVSVIYLLITNIDKICIFVKKCSNNLFAFVKKKKGAK